MAHEDDEGSPLATLQELAHIHDDFSPDDLAPLIQPRDLFCGLDEDVIAMIRERPYRSAFIAFAIGFLGGVLIERANRPRLYSRGW